MVSAVNTRLLLKGRLEGIGRFTFETLTRITASHPEHTFIFLFDRPFSDEFVFAGNVIPVVVSPPARHPLLWYIWFEWQIPRVLRKYRADVFLSTDGYVSLRTKIPQVNVIHDINFVHRPKDLPWLTARYYNHYFPKFARIARKLVTVSEYSRGDISASFGIAKEKIDVVYNGCNPAYTPVSDEEKSKIRDKYTNGMPYFLFVGALHPRKNVEGLLKAFELYKTETSGKEKLVIVGGQMVKTGSISETLASMHFRDDVIFTGRLPGEELRQVLGGALAMTFVPFFEGFGIPVIEAMSAGIPVICSNTTSLPEVGGDAVYYADPGNVGEIAGAMHSLSASKELRMKLIEKGHLQCKKFSWDESAEKMWQIILELSN
jgi:glycosyltransferase involved in cell wall biosynthesis